MNEIVVAKFGGSSLADSRQFRKVKDIVLEDKRRKYIVPSAPGKRDGKDYKITDLLYLCYEHVVQKIAFDEVFKIIEKRYIELCNELELNLNIEQYLDEIKEKISEGASADYTASRGEYLNGMILASFLGYEFVDAKDIILFNKNGQLDLIGTQKLITDKLLNKEKAVIPGFYGSTINGKIKTFSRGGSDITGSIIARGVGAILYENWTDVSGFLMADPRIVKNPKPIEKITYKELRELSYMGATVLHDEAIFPVKSKEIPIHIKNTNVPQDKGTIILSDLSPVSNYGTITGIAGKKDFTVIAIEKTRMSVEKGFFRKLLSILEANDVLIEHMPSSIDSVSLVIADSELENKLEDVVEEIKNQCDPDAITIYPNMALIAVVGRGMIKTKGISAKVFGALREDKINIRMITQGSSELNIIVGIENEDFEKAINSIYRAFI